MSLVRHLILLLLLPAALIRAQDPAVGTLVGSVMDKVSKRPLASVALTLKPKSDANLSRQAVTDDTGAFRFEGLALGDYTLAYGQVGSTPKETPPFTIRAGANKLDLGRLELDDGVLLLEKMKVTSSTETFSNSIDRKVYNVGSDLRSATGTASELLQNIPSIQVDVEGNVSLRGSDSVLILIDGHSSAMMGRNRATALEQMPADSIDKIEVITNPSAKYKPDGTAGIINITLKKKSKAALSGSVRFSVGNDSRYNAGASVSATEGKVTVFGSASLRQDSRNRHTTDIRSHVDSTSGALVTTNQHTDERARPLSRIAQAGFEYRPDNSNKLGADVNFNRRSFDRFSVLHSQIRDDRSGLTSDYDRLRTDPEYEQNIEGTLSFQHSFADEGHELNMDLKHEDSREQENNRYTNQYRTPAQADSQDAHLIKTPGNRTEFSAEYANPLTPETRIEAGYTLERDQNDMDFRGSYLDPNTGAWLVDTQQTNRFLYNDTIHALYFTCARSFGPLGTLAGLRMEQTAMDMNQVATAIQNKNDYFRLYPSLHLSYRLSDTGQLQLNYSHRVRHPESDDLNPFPEYQDPYNLRAGNPHLMPEETHSIETGYQYKKDDTTYLATLYYRYTYRGFTTVSRYIDSTTLLTTYENLARTSAEGLELATTRNIGKHVSLNGSANAYRSQIDASNLGFSASRSTLAVSAKLNVSYHATKRDVFQLNSNYAAKRLTPQGYRQPSFVANLGYKHTLKDQRTSFVITVSDLFNSFKERTHINTPVLSEDITRRRSQRIIYLGIVTTFGKSARKNKDDNLQFDNQL